MLLVLAIICLPFVLGAGWVAYQLRPGSQGKPVVVRVQEGWGASEIGSALAEGGVIDSSLVFQVWSTVTRAGPYEAGAYQMHKGIGIRAAISRLEDGPFREPDVELLLPPGETLAEIAERVGKLPGHSAEKFMEVLGSGTVRSKYQPAEVTSLEGLLFPDTYFIGPDDDEDAIAKKLVARFDEIADKVGLGSASRATPYQTVVIASLIETEAKLAEDAPLISAVIYNRLRDGMQLQIDSTLCFAKGGCPPPPTDADKLISSPYNTYAVGGLPPTPISSLTEASLAAALAPADVPFKFYVLAEANGKHAFATTLEEHERNVEAARAKGLL
jgi:UPF0755 protein